MQIQTAFRTIPLTRPLWMGIVNATPDSFSDGGRPDPAGHAISLLLEGADILDVGGESTRPGCDPVSASVEIGRIAPVIEGIFARVEALRLEKPLLSVDTYHPETARFALEHGVEILNDISGAEDPEMIRAAVDFGAAICFMHKKGTPKTMQENPTYDDVTAEVLAYLAARRDALLDAGIPREKLIADPGLGFGKTFAHNWTLVEQMDRFQELEIPILVGHSRKGFLRPMCEKNPGMTRDDATRIVTQTLIEKGVQILRTHVKPV